MPQHATGRGGDEVASDKRGGEGGGAERLDELAAVGEARSFHGEGRRFESGQVKRWEGGNVRRWTRAKVRMVGSGKCGDVICWQSDTVATFNPWAAGGRISVSCKHRSKIDFGRGLA